MHICKAIHQGHCEAANSPWSEETQTYEGQGETVFHVDKVLMQRGTKVEITWGNKMGEVTQGAHLLQAQLHPVGHQLQYFLRMYGEQALFMPFGYSSYSLHAIQE